MVNEALTTPQWRKAYADSLATRRGWMSLVSLDWLADGEIALLRTRGAKQGEPLGTVTRLGDAMVVAPTVGRPIKVNGIAVRNWELASDIDGTPDLIECGPDTWAFIKRGDRFGIRGWNIDHGKALARVGLRWAPLRPQLNFLAKWVPYTKPRTVLIANVLGQRTPSPMHGYAEFRINNRVCRLEGTGTPEQGMVFFNFRDSSCNTVAYQPGRFLDAPFTPSGRIRLDFNRAYNPPCAYASFATCPLPHRENILKVAIEAGELRFPGHAH
ncbi:MAG: DUF1684 domain-containing protein [Armatimonadota bacterium]